METFERFASMSPTPVTNRLGISEQALLRFLEKITILESGYGCWLWLGSKPNGYGQVRITEVNGKVPIGAHVLSYRLSVGDIPAGCQMHHRVEDGCIGPACVNPAHLECVNPSKHIDLTPTNPTAVNRNRTHCICDHEFTPENTRSVKGGTGRSCIICELTREKERTARRSTGNPAGRPIQEFCINGHPMSGENLYIGTRSGRDGGGVLRACKACRNANTKAYNQRHWERMLANKRKYREQAKIRKQQEFYDQFK